MILATTRRVDLAAGALAVALALAPAAHAQVLYGTITGNVTDTTDGALAGATVQVVNIATGVAKDTVSDARGVRSADPTSFIQFRNAYPTVFVWAMLPGRFNGAENTFLPVTTLRQGLVAPSAPPDLSQGRLLLPTGTGTTTYPKDFERGSIHSFNATVERELKPWLTAQAAYVGTRALGQMNFININAGAPGTGNAGRPLVLAGLTNVTADVNSYEPYGDTEYDGLQTQMRARSRTAQGGIVYTWSKTTNYADNGGGNAAGAGGPRIQYAPEKERNKGPAGYDRTHNFQAFWVWNLPFGPGEKWAADGWSGAIFGGWQVNGIWTMMSGTPIYIVQGTGLNLNAAGSQQVPDLVKNDVEIFSNNSVNRPPAGADSNQYQYFDRSAYQVVNIAAGQPQRFGTSPRNSLRGPGFWNVDLGLFRTFSLPGTASLQFRFEVLNALNHPNFANPSNNVSDAATFGFITQTTGVGERNIRLGARFIF